MVEAVSLLKSVYSEIPNYDMILKVILDYGIFELPNKCKLTPGNSSILHSFLYFFLSLFLILKFGVC